MSYIDDVWQNHSREAERTTTVGGIVVIGAGNWGTTIALSTAPYRTTRLWTHSAEQAAELNRSRMNAKYLPDISFPETLIVEPTGHSTIGPDDIIVLAVPSHAVRKAVVQLKSLWSGQVIVSCAKGYELHNGHTTSLETPAEIIEKIIPGVKVVVWAGPNIAREIAMGLPTRAVLAGRDMAALTMTVRMLKNDRVSFEVSRDVRGVELCSSLKGVIAMAVGLGDGLELGDNFTGLLVAYGLREFTAIAEFLGITKETIYGIAGLGDCVTSSLSPFGRNRSFGRLIGQGVPPRQALNQVGMVVEGVQMLLTIAELEDLNVPTPLFSALKEIVFELFDSKAESENVDPLGSNERKLIRRHLTDTIMNYNCRVPKKPYILEAVA